VKAQTAATPEVRITVDNRAQNNAFSRTHCPTKTIEELLYEANGSRLFSKLDIIKAFDQLMLEVSQRQLISHHDARRPATIHETPHGTISCVSGGVHRENL
jgi:hypothetical protein